jgi:diguanylate cyclase (GGDEF)-like protein
MSDQVNLSFDSADANQRIAAARNLDELARLAIDQLCKTYRCDAAFLLSQPQSSEATCWAASPTSLPNLMIPGLPAQLDDTNLAGRAFASGKTLAVTEPGGAAGQYTTVAVPLKSNDAVLGVMQLSGVAPNANNPGTLAALESLAAKFASAVTRLRAQTSDVSTSATPSRDTRAPLHLQKIYESIYRGVSELMPCDVFFIALSDEENHAAEFVFRVERDAVLPVEHVPLSDGLIEYTLRSHRAVIVVDVERETRFRARLWGVPGAACSLVCVPMEYENKTFGVLSAQSYRPNAFGDVHARVLTTLADQAALTIYNARLLAENQRKLKQLAVLGEVTRIVSSTIEIGQLMELIYGEVRRILPADAYYVALLDEQKQVFKVEVLVDEGERFDPAVIPLGDNFATRVYQQRAPLLLKNIPQQAPALGVTCYSVGKPKTSASWLGVPMMLSQHFIGVLAVSSYHPAAFDESDQEILQSVAMQAAIVIDNAQHHAEVEQQAQHDSLTGALNHGFFLVRLHEEIERARTNSAPLSLIMLDLDHFKEYNDSFGHLIGDAVLRGVVQAILFNLKSGDLVGRWGGEEFVVALPRCSRQDARQVAERIRKSLNGISVRDEGKQPLPVPTASQGIAAFPEDATEPIALVDTADIALYKAKARGRDKISMAGEE